MLNEGRRRKRRGTDVVIGSVETYGRPLTEQQIGDLEIVPRKPVTYRGITLAEMDTDAILARHPQVALVDERRIPMSLALRTKSAIRMWRHSWRQGSP
jgi:two-component system sensor histidine kinase KdpD